MQYYILYDFIGVAQFRPCDADFALRVSSDTL